jgi:hypothetical protein
MALLILTGKDPMSKASHIEQISRTTSLHRQLDDLLQTISDMKKSKGLGRKGMKDHALAQFSLMMCDLTAALDMSSKEVVQWHLEEASRNIRHLN